MSQKLVKDIPLTLTIAFLALFIPSNYYSHFTQERTEVQRGMPKIRELFRSRLGLELLSLILALILLTIMPMHRNKRLDVGGRK